MTRSGHFLLTSRSNQTTNHSSSTASPTLILPSNLLGPAWSTTGFSSQSSLFHIHGRIRRDSTYLEMRRVKAAGTGVKLEDEGDVRGEVGR